MQRICETCGQLFRTFPSKIKLGGGRYCNKICFRPTKTRRRKKIPPEQRFWPKIDKSPGPDACWIWTGTPDPKGYGQFMVREGCRVSSHRYAYELTHGPIPAGVEIRHSCDTPLCCNPAHLLPGTHADNMADALERNRIARGERYKRSNLTAATVLEIRAQAAAGVSRSQLALLYGVHYNTIVDIVRRRTWTHI